MLDSGACPGWNPDPSRPPAPPWPAPAPGPRPSAVTPSLPTLPPGILMPSTSRWPRLTLTSLASARAAVSMSGMCIQKLLNFQLYGFCL